MDIQRGNFSDHIWMICSKVPVPCSNEADQCKWVGPRDQLSNHLTQCNTEIKKYILSQHQDIKKHDAQMQRNMEEILLQHKHRVITSRLQSEMKCLEKRIQTIQNEDEDLKSKLLDLGCRSELMESRISKVEKLKLRKYAFLCVGNSYFCCRLEQESKINALFVYLPIITSYNTYGEFIECLEPP
jgi:chaperonin cofactor prefoldin